jgi:hypothetical protein
VSALEPTLAANTCRAGQRRRESNGTAPRPRHAWSCHRGENIMDIAAVILDFTAIDIAP